jgi:hypothetical protein
MAIPRGYKRGSGGFLQPVGRVPSGTTSGPGFQEGLSREQKDKLIASGKKSGLSELESKAIAFGGQNVKWKAARAKVMEHYTKAQAQHEKTMAEIAKAESTKFDTINEALNASKETDPKDKLGNTVPSEQTKYLEMQLINIMGQASQRNKKLTPKGAGIRPDQLDPETGKLPVRQAGPAAPPEPQRSPSGAKLKAPYRTPIKGTEMVHPEGNVKLTGKSRMQNGIQEVEATINGKVGWVPMGELKPKKVGPGGLEALEQFYAPKPDPGDTFNVGP